MTTITRSRLFIGGTWVEPSSSKQLTGINSTTEEVLGNVPEATEADGDAAVAAAREAFDRSGWATTDPAERAKTMRRFADAIDARQEEIARLVTQQVGMPLELSRLFETSFPPTLLRYYADLATSTQFEERRPSPMGFDTLVRREPVGVVAAITPWNFPVIAAMMKIAPALAAGCTMVVKPSPDAALDSFLLAEAAEEAELPPGVINWVPGGSGLGAHLVSHPDVDKVAFTGSSAIGRIVGEACGRLLRPVSLELGGKSAGIVLDDADLDIVLRDLPLMSMANGGQACAAITRILAPRSRYDEVVDAVAGWASSRVIGDPLDAGTQIGPVATARHRNRIEAHIAKGKAEGARLVAGGGRPSSRQRGWYVEPTVFADVAENATIAQEEIFGPVVAILPYDGDAEAVRIANNSEYGLGGAVWSADSDRTVALARRMRTGTVSLNGTLINLNAPFGGWKASGLGRELGPEGMDNYLQSKSIFLS